MSLVHDEARAFLPYPDVAVANAANGPLSGLTFAVKDLFDVAGYPTGGGNPFVLVRSGIKTRTAPAVQCLLDAGARFAGKVVTDEFAFSMNGNNVHFGAPVNGAAPDRITGGSSSGSAAAVSHRLVDFALGTDTGGSVRAPANHCGLYGIRPTHGRISLQSVMDLSPSLDTCGYFARDAHTFGRVSDVLLGADAHPLPARIRLLKPADVWALLSDPVRAAQAEPLARLAQGLRDATGGSGSASDFSETIVAPAGFDPLYWNFRYLQGREAWSSDGALIERYKVPMGADVAARFAWSQTVTDEQVEGAARLRESFRSQLATLLGNDGVLVIPTMPDIAPLRSEDGNALEQYRASAIQLLCLAGLSGFPQISLPLGTREGAPLGLSLLGPAGSDLSLIRLAQRI
jgi:amidase